MTVIKKRAEALAAALTALEAQWEEHHHLGIGYDIDDETGKVIVTFGPDGCPEKAVRIVTDIHSIFVGQGPAN